MFYTTVPPTYQVDRVRLLPQLEAARAEAGRETRIFAVAVQLDSSSRRLVASEPGLSEGDPKWTTPVEQHADGSLTAKGPIPVDLYVDRSGHPPLHGLALPHPLPESWHLFD